MSIKADLPRQNSDLGGGNPPTREWYNFFRRLRDDVNKAVPPQSSGGSNTNIFQTAPPEPTIVDASTARTLTAGDANTVIEFTSGSAITVTVASNASEGIPTDSTIYLVQGGAGQVTVSPAVGVTIDYSDSLKTRTQESMIGLKQIQPDKWELFGDAEPVAPARSALIRSANSSGVPAWTAPTADGQVLKRSSGTLVFGALTAAEVTNTPAGTIAATDVQTALNELDTEKQVVITGGATTITTANLTASRALVSDGSGKVGVATTTAAEIGYVNGVTSAIQTQLNGKQAALTSGIATMVAGTVTVNTAAVTATTRIMLTTQVLGTVTAPKAIAVTARVASTSFTITSEDATDTSDVAWVLVQA